MRLFSRLCHWLIGRGAHDLGVMPLDNPHVRMLVYLGELRTRADMWSRVEAGPTQVGDRVVEERERRVALLNARPKFRVMNGGRG